MSEVMECAAIVMRQECRSRGISGRREKRGSVEISVLIPVFNERNTILEVIRRVQEQPFEKEIIIVDDCSTDGTREIVQDYADRGLVKLILQDRPRGKGYAVRTGLEAVTGDVILIQDGDLEYSVEDYPSLLAPIEAGRASFVLGSRHVSGRFISSVLRRQDPACTS